MTAQSLPQSIEAEESLVGGVLLHPPSWSKVAHLVAPDDFHHPSLRAIYEAMLELDSAGKPIDTLTIVEQMKELGTIEKLNAVKGSEYLLELQTRVVSVENLEHHAKIIRGKATKRRIISAGTQIVSKGYSDEDVDEVVGTSERLVFEVAARSHTESYVAARKLIRSTIGELEKRFVRFGHGGYAVTGVPTGNEQFDEMTLGLQPGDLVIAAARPSMGKTSLVTQWLLHAAIERRMPGLLFSCEMSKGAIMERMLSAVARVDSQAIRRGRLTQHDWVSLTKAAELIHSAPIYIDDTSSPTITEIRSKVRKWRHDPQVWTAEVREKNPHGLAVVALDYLQLATAKEAAGRDNDRQKEISEISRGLKSIAKDTQVAFVALSQLSRKLEERKDKRPMMNDLRESGAIEQDADLISFIYRDEVYSKDECAEEDRGVAEIIIGKQRNGPTGTVRTRFVQEYTRFEPLPRRRED